MSKLLGILCLLLGSALAVWIAYNLLVERQEAAKGLNPIPALLFSAGLLYVGVKRVRAPRPKAQR